MRGAPQVDEAQIPALQAQWGAAHHILLPRLIGAELLADIQPRFADAAFVEHVHPASGHETVMTEGPAQRLLDFLLNDPRLLRVMERVTACGRIGGCLNGRIYRLMPGTDEGHDWHDDNVRGRVLGLSINLTPSPFAGGQLELRERRTGTPVAFIANTGAGDAVVFRLGPIIEHRVLPVTGDTPRYAYAGWFEAGPSLKERLDAQWHSRRP
jgi:hypothetical protein